MNNKILDEYNRQIDLFKSVCSELGRVLRTTDLRKNKWGIRDARWLINNCPDEKVTNYCEFLEYLGFIPYTKVSKKLAIKIILDMQQKLNRPLEYSDFIKNKNNNCINIKTINNYWKNLNNMKKELNLEIVRENMILRKKTKEEMLCDMKIFINTLNKLPNNNEIDNNPNTLNTSSYCKYFGSVNNVFLLLGYTPKKKSISLYLTNNDIVNIYKDFIDGLGAVPTHNYCNNIYELPSPRTVLRRFKCKWNDFMRILGYEPNQQATKGEISYAKDGTKCLSKAECILHNYFVDNNIKIISKEYLYKNLIEDKHLKDLIGYKRCDWLLSKNNELFIVEYFVMIGNFNYDKIHDFKLKFIEMANLKNNFIPIYPKDMSKLDDIFKQFKRCVKQQT